MKARAVDKHAYRKEMMELVRGAGGGIVVEVGVHQGALTRLLLTLKTIVRLYLVDTWPDKAVFSQAAQLAVDSRIEILRMPSVVASELFADRSVDIVQIDADHEYESVADDIRAWMPKVRVGGTLCGDDFQIPGVQKAVRELIDNRRLQETGRVWWSHV